MRLLIGLLAFMIRCWCLDPGCTRGHLGIALRWLFWGGVWDRMLSIILEDQVSLALSNDGMDALPLEY